MRIWNIAKWLLGLTFICSLSACVGGHAAQGSPSSWGNYRCHASAGGHVSTGWSTSMSTARANALDKCRAHAAGGACKITQCVDES